MFYTDVFTERSKVYVRGWYSDGTRLQQTYDYEPYLFEETDRKTPWRTLDGRPVDKVQFSTIREAKDYVKQFEDVENAPPIYGMTDFIYPFIFDTFGPNSVKYDGSLVRVGSIDVEVQSDKGFPEPSSAEYPITAITVGNRKLQVTLGLKPYAPKAKNHKYILCKSETDLFYKFLEVWKHFDFDVITGWNVEKFDIPYIVRRGWKVVGEEAIKTLSPWNRVYEKETFDPQYEETSLTYQIRGVVTLDYMVLYKKFSYSPQESYRLDHIAYVELGTGKLDYSEYDSLNELYEKDHDKFIDYNLRDNVLIFELDDKMGFIAQVMAIAYDSMINYADALTSVKLWEVIAHNHLLRQGIVTPPRRRKKKGRRILGGFVKEPLTGRWRWIVSYDFTSLYPHLIMMFNISPETMLRERILELYRPSACVDMIMDGYLEGEAQLRAVAYDATLVPLGIMYTNSKEGFFPELMSTMYKDRKLWKDRELEHSTKLVEIEDEMKRRGIDVEHLVH